MINLDVSCVAISSFNCQTAVSSLCTICSPGYYLDSINPSIPKCTICITPCKTCTSSAICLTCIDLYFLSGNNCLSCPTYCSNCNSATLCTACITPTIFILVDTIGNISCGTIASKNCSKAVASLCTECLLGSYFDISGSNANYPICTICPTNCYTCTSATLCTACTPSTSYILVNTTGNINCVTL